MLRAAERVAVPWKNGGGVTREVAIWPPGANLDTCDWRVSIAEVRKPGPFSHFEGIDRTLMILQGRIVLTFTDRAVELDPDSAPFAFPGDVPCAGQPLNGPVIDLNVMVRRGHGAAQVERIVDGTTSLAAKMMLVVAAASTDVRLGDRYLALLQFDAVLIDEPSEFQLSLGGTGWMIRID
jgi:uncharacterized protein